MADDNDDSVGYCKPPKATRFKKGQSGNPRGRPRKPKAPQFKLLDTTPQQIFDREMSRVIRVIDNGKSIEMTAGEGIQRAQVVKALQGSRLAQERLLDKLETREREKLQKKKEFFEFFESIKQRSIDLLANYKKKGLPPPELFPHPSEIELCYDTYDVIFHGPVSEEHDRDCKRFTKLRDYFLRRAVWECKGPNFIREQDGKTQINLAYYLSQLFNKPPLPRRYRWTEAQEVCLVMSANVSIREQKRQLAVDHAWIDNEEHFFPVHFDPELVALMKRLYKNGVAHIWFNVPAGKLKEAKLRAA